MALDQHPKPIDKLTTNLYTIPNTTRKEVHTWQSKNLNSTHPSGKCCDELRGGMDASQYKDYILTLLFMKYVSDKAEKNPYEVIQVPEGGSFADMVKLRGNAEIGDKINKIIAKIRRGKRVG